MNSQNSNGHLVNVLSVLLSCLVLSGNMYFRNVGNYIPLARMPSGKRFVKFAMEGIADFNVCMFSTVCKILCVDFS